MATVTEDNTANPRLAYLVNADTDSAIGTSERDSITITFNEENDEFEPSTDTRVKVDPTTEQPTVEFDGARAVDNSALEELGVFVEDADGNLEYTRGSEREWDALEIWYFDADDADLAADEPDVRERFEDVRWDIDSQEVDGNTLTFSAECHVEGDLYGDYTPPA